MKKTIIYQGREVEVIDCTPTWESILPALLLVLEQGTREGQEIAKKELLTMARAADRYNDYLKENNNLLH